MRYMMEMREQMKPMMVEREELMRAMSCGIFCSMSW